MIEINHWPDGTFFVGIREDETGFGLYSHQIYLRGNEQARALADAIYNDLGLGWLPYPENKPEVSDEFEVTALNQDGMKFVDIGYYATQDEKWYRAYAGNMGFYGIVAYRIKSAPYQPA